MFLVMLHRSGRATFARDPWSETHLRVATIDPWTIRLDGRAG
jgi:hypothetical protein